MKHILVTGGAGFIGSHLVRHFVKKYPEYHLVNLDYLTYAGNSKNILDLLDYDNYTFLRGDICDENFIQGLFQKYQFEYVIHLAAESHVDNSISNPLQFVKTNVFGTVNLLTQFNQVKNKKLFYHVSTDEVYGELSSEGYFTEETPYAPSSPYSASKASSDHFVRAYGKTYNMPYIISNCSNNYGPNQYPEKLIPLFISNIIQSKPLPVYGNGKNIRDWLFVGDHVLAIDHIFHNGTVGETYNIGSNNEIANIQLVNKLCNIADKLLEKPEGTSEKLITYIDDRPGHDYRYSIDSSKLRKELGWTPLYSFEKNLEETVKWYINNQCWYSE